MKSLVVDAGFLVALWNAREQHHAWAIAVAEANPPPWFVCEAVFAETDHLLNLAGRRSLRMAIRRGALQVVGVLSNETTSVLALLDKYGGGPVGVGTLAAALSEEEDAIEEIYEPYLMQIGMIDRTPRGRVATPRAYEYFGRDLPRRQPRLF